MGPSWFQKGVVDVSNKSNLEMLMEDFVMT